MAEDEKQKNPAPVAPSIATQPSSQTITAGQNATFSVIASGTAPLGYQWQKNGTAISGATSPSYTTPAEPSDTGAKFSVVVTNSSGSATSNPATLTVKEPLWPEIIYRGEHGATKTTKSLDLPFREGFGFDFMAAQIRFTERVLALAQLAEPSEWSKIVAAGKDIQSIRRCMQHSPLEMNAAILFTTLAYSPQSQWTSIIKKFFKECSLDAAIPRGRPRLNPSKVTALACGKLIEEAETKLKPGYQIKAEAKKRGGFDSDDDQIKLKLAALGYDNEQTTAILEAASEGDAACRYFEEIQGTRRRSLKRIQNIFSEYRRLKERI